MIGTGVSQKDLKVTNISGAAGGGGASYSVIANIPKAVRIKLISEGRVLIGGAKKAKAIWLSMRKADFRKEGILNEANLELVFDKNKDIIFDLLKILTPKDFIETFDVDKDGYLNQDEQVMIFTIIKEKMSLFAESLSAMHEYDMFKDLMKEVRTMEEDIVKFQDQLRTNIQNNQLHDYIKIGDDKLKQFYEAWEGKFQLFQEESLNRIEDLKQTHQAQMQLLNQKLERAVQALKQFNSAITNGQNQTCRQIKGNASPRKISCSQREVIRFLLNHTMAHRIEQAQNYRRELKILQVREAQRVQMLRNASAEKQRRQLLAAQRKEMLQLEAKIQNQRNNMKIRMEKQLDVLQKQINLHVNDIKRIQGLIKRLAIKKGLNADQIRRLKQKARNTQKYLKQTKQVESIAKQVPTGSKTAGGMSGSIGMSGTIGPHGGTTRPAAGTMGAPVGGGGATANFDAGIIGRNPFLFSGGKRGGMMTSLSNTYSSNPGLLNILMPIRQILSQGKLTLFDIASESEKDKKGCNEEDSSKQTGGLRQKIKNLLDQRKPPSEKLPSLIGQYDDDLNLITSDP